MARRPTAPKSPPRSATRRRAKPVAPSPDRDLEALLARVREAEQALRPLLPDIDPGDLNLILFTLFRPAEDRISFLREIRPGVYAV